MAESCATDHFRTCGFNRHLAMPAELSEQHCSSGINFFRNLEYQGRPILKKGSFLGPAFDDDEIHRVLKANNAVFTTVKSDDELCSEVATLLAEENVVGWFQGRMEFGPRALGARSLLGDARSDKMQTVMNLKIKFRESFRPFAPIVLQENVHEYFQLKPGTESPYMLLVAPVHERIRTPATTARDTAFGIEKLRQPRSEIPAVTHVDYSARVQTVDAERNPLTHQLLTRFREKTGCPVLINTSFNVRSEPIVCTPDDAFRCFLMTDMDVLVIGHHILKKTEQDSAITSEDRQRYLSQFAPD